MTDDIVERLTYRAENLWAKVRPHAAILDLEAAAEIERLRGMCAYKDEVIDQRNAECTRNFHEIERLHKVIEDAFMAGFESGFSEGFWCEENPAHWEQDCIDPPEKYFEAWSKEREENNSTFT